MTAQTVSAARRAHGGSGGLRWSALALLLLAPLLVTALTQDIGGRAFDAASEHIYRGVAFSAVVDDGALYPRWSQHLHWGLGSPLFTFQPPLPYYGMDLLYRLGIPHSLGWRFLIAAGLALAFFGAYLLVREISGRRWPALVAAVAFVYAPYVIWNGLERGSNEAYGVFLYPLVLWSLLWLAKKPDPVRFLLAAILWAACIASHVLAPLILAPFAGLLAVFLAVCHRTAAPVLAFVAGGLLTAFVWLPMVPEQRWVHVERDFTQPGAIPLEGPLNLDHLLAPPVPYDTMRDDNRDPLRAGVPQTVMLLLGAPVAAYLWRRERKVAAWLLASTVVGLFLLFMLTGWSDWVWQTGGAVLARLLYRMRLMGLQALAAATAAGLVLVAVVPRWRRFVAPALAFVFVLFALPTLYVQYHRSYADFSAPPDLAGVRAMEIRHGGTALTAFGEFTPQARTAPFDAKLLAELGADFDAQGRPLANPTGEVEVQSGRVRNQAWDLRVSAPAPVTAILHLLYYPRWRATLDGQPVSLAPQPGTGYAQVALPAGVHQLSLRYVRTTAEWAGLMVSAVTLLALLVAAARGARRGRFARSAAPSAPAFDSEAPPALWLVAALAGLVVLKFAVVDPYTTLFRCVSTDKRVCGAQVTTRAAFPGAPELAGFTVQNSALAPGEGLRLDLYWRGVAPTPGVLSTFVHVRPSGPDQQPNPRSENGMWAQAAQITPAGFLTRDFRPGMLYKDEYRLTLPADIPRGQYFLEVGWFDPASGEQLDIPAEAIGPELRILWRSVLLPDVTIR